MKGDNTTECGPFVAARRRAGSNRIVPEKEKPKKYRQRRGQRKNRCAGAADIDGPGGKKRDKASLGKEKGRNRHKRPPVIFTARVAVLCADMEKKKNNHECAVVTNAWLPSNSTDRNAQVVTYRN